MKKLLHYPFLCLLVLTAVLAAPFIWKEMGLPPEGLPTLEQAELPLPELKDPAPPQETVTAEPNVALPPDTTVTVPDNAAVDVPVVPDVPINQPEPSPSGPIRDQPPEEEEAQEPPAPPKPENPFEGALFIGDSRTVGIGKYAGITEADFFATTGMSVYSIFDEKVKVGDRTEKCTLETLLSEEQYDRIYLMLGINELGYNLERTAETYGTVVARLRELQPEAYIYIQANLHVTKKKSDSDKTYNNDRINRLNESISAFADGEQVHYLDVNPVYDDENGAMTANYTWDEVHLMAKHYALWADYLRENTPA